jgi:hypothetical protein
MSYKELLTDDESMVVVGGAVVVWSQDTRWGKINVYLWVPATQTQISSLRTLWFLITRLEQHQNQKI